MSPVLKLLASGGAMILIGAAPATGLAATGLNVAVVAAPGTAGAAQPGAIEGVLRTVMTTLAERGHAPGSRRKPFDHKKATAEIPTFDELPPGERNRARPRRAAAQTRRAASPD